MELKTRELMMDTYDVLYIGPFKLDPERLQQAHDRWSVLSALPLKKQDVTPEFMGLELDLLQAMYLCRVLKEWFKIASTPIPIRYWFPQISEAQAIEIAQAAHERYMQEHPEVELGPLTLAQGAIGMSYGFSCEHITARRQGKVPGLWWLGVDRVDGSVSTPDELSAWEVVGDLLSGRTDAFFLSFKKFKM